MMNKKHSFRFQQVTQTGVIRMDRSNVICLIRQKYTQDNTGQEIAEETEREVFCDIQSISREEFFEAGQNDITPVYKATMFKYDYNDEKIAIVFGEKLAVYRTYIKQGEYIELYLKREVGIDVTQSKC